MYLHKDKSLFIETIQNVSKALNIWDAVIEKDYYVTLILKELANASDKIVFKGGTSLSKARKAINRFSEDVDISFTEHIGASPLVLHRRGDCLRGMQPIRNRYEA